jgi:uncharacterized membrane protein YgdD (TMEM256/DUF423 family)
MSRTRAGLFALAGFVILVLAVIEAIDQELTVWNGLSIVIGALLFVWGAMTARRST